MCDSPVVDGEAHILCAVLQADVGVFGAELDLLAAGVGHGEGQRHGLKLLGRRLVVPDVHQARDEVLVHLQEGGERGGHLVRLWESHTHTHTHTRDNWKRRLDAVEGGLCVRVCENRYSYFRS